MNLRRLILTFVCLLVALPSLGIAQIQQFYPAQNVLVPQPVYTQGTVVSQGVIIPQMTSNTCGSTCHCNPQTSGDCKCKCLDCKVALKTVCKTTTPHYKRPVKCEIYGSIPEVEECVNCHTKVKDFQFMTEVPQISRKSETCIEIGKKLLQCLPGCCFDVCVPTFECKADTHECKMVLKNMPMELWQRTEGSRIVYDVFVINSRDLNSAYHAGGMPAKWVVMHCATLEEVKARFPGAIAKAAKGAKPVATSADVDVKLIIDQAKIDEHLKQGTEIEGKKEAA